MIADEELMAYVDDELDADARARIERAMADDPGLRARIESQLDLKRRLAAHFDPVLKEPVPATLSQGVASKSAVGAGRRGWHWQEWMAIAATLVIGVMLGPFVLRSSQPLPLMSAAGRVVAIGPLETALMQNASGEGTEGGMTIGMSFRDSDGSYCRTFAMNPGPAGLACREWGEWVVEVLARNPRARQGSAGETYRQAGTAFPAAVRNAVEARIKGEPMTAEQEAEANSRNWRRPD